MNFFVLRKPRSVEGKANTTFLPVDGSITGEAPLCATCGGYVGMLPLLPPIRVELKTLGTEYGDFVFGVGDEILISARAEKILRKSDILGLNRIGPAEIIKVKSRRKLIESMPKYICYGVCRSRAAVDYNKSGLQHDQSWYCEDCRLGGNLIQIDRIVIESGSWSGEDVFFARGLPGVILTSNRFVSICKQNILVSSHFVPADEFNYNWR